MPDREQTAPRDPLYSSKVGLMLPPSPRGLTNLMDLNTEPDFRASNDALVVGWETDPAVTREYVPEPLEVDGSGRMYLMTVARWNYSGRNRAEFISPERHTQIESFIKIPCSYRGQRYVYVSSSWGNRDRMVTAGRQVGMYHKWADIQMTQFHPFHPVWSGPHEGARINVIVENIGTVLRASGTLARPLDPAEPQPEAVLSAREMPFIGHRYIYDSCARTPLKNDLVAQVGGGRETGPIWTGEGWIEFQDAENEEVLQFAPRRMLGAWWYNHRSVKGEGGGGPRVVHDYGAVHPFASRPRIKEMLEAES